jgi:uncharacterized delta-60 repeat protein
MREGARPTGFRAAPAVAAAVAILMMASATQASSVVGSLDLSYGTDGSGDALIQGPSGTAYDPGGLTALPDGSSLVADERALGLTELSSGGAPVPGFGSGGTAKVAFGSVGDSNTSAVALAPSGTSYLVTGTIDENDLAVAEFNSDGTLDTSFASGSPTPGVYEFNNDPVQGTAASSSEGADLVVQSDGTIFVVGTEDIGAPATAALVLDRITSDGSAEERFTMQADGQPTTGDAVALGPNGTIYVAGTENAGSANAKAVVARITRGGLPAKLELDTSFNPSGSTPGVVTSTLHGSSAELSALATAPDGSAVIAGEATSSGVDDGVVARVTTAGALDPNFGSGGVETLPSPAGDVALSNVRALVLEPNGAPLIAGDSYSDGPPATRWFVAELTTKGALDPTFDPGGTGTVEPGVTVEAASAGYNDVSVTGLSTDYKGRLLLAVDLAGTSATDEADVQRFIGYAPPSASFTLPAVIYAGQAATFNGSGSSDPIGNITDYAWDFDGSGTYATDGAGSPTIGHTFAATEHLTVSLRVTNNVGQTATASEPVNVLPPASTTSAVASVTPAQVTLNPYVNGLNSDALDGNPETVSVTNVGAAPLTISAVKLTTSGGWWITSGCAQSLGSDGYFTGSCQGITFPAPANTCTGATLAPGVKCYVRVAAGDGGKYPVATGTLEIDSNSPTSPDRVPLSATAVMVATPTQPPQVRCPAYISANGAAAGPNIDYDGPKLFGCWTDLTAQTPNASGDSWSAIGAVTLDDGVVLSPTNTEDRLILTPQPNGEETLSATPASAAYTVSASPLDSGAVPTIALGVVALGAHPYVCSASSPPESGSGAFAPYGSCALPMEYIRDSPPDTVHNLQVVGGQISFGTCGTETSAIALLPSMFTTDGRTPGPSNRPTSTLEFGTSETGCGTGGTGGFNGLGPGAPNAVTCPGTNKVTPDCNGKSIPPDHPQPTSRDTATPAAATPGFRASLAPRYEGDDDDGSNCPAGYEDYTDAVPDAFLGAMQFGNAYLCYDPGSQIWTTGGSVDLANFTAGVLHATVDTGPPPNGGISFNSSGQFVGGGIQSATFDPAIPLAPAVSLDSFGGYYETHPTRIKAQATVGIGGLFSITGGVFAVWASPQFPYTYQPDDIPNVKALQTDDPTFKNFAAGIGGTVSLTPPGISSITLASAYGLYAASDYFEFGGCLGDNCNGVSLLGVATLQGYVRGAVNTGTGQYNIAAGVTACADFPLINHTCIGLNGDASNEGIGGCVTLGPFTGGLIYEYGGGVTIIGPFSCDLGPITVAVTRSMAIDRNVAHVSPTSGAVSLNLTGHPPSKEIYVSGTGGSPLLSLTGPHGQQLSETSAGAGVHSGDLVIWPEPKQDQTIVAIKNPAAGEWTLTPLAGSPPISKVTYANGLAPAKISTTVSGHGPTRTLSYRVMERAGQVVRFAERGGQVFHILGQAHGSRGKLKFTPAPGPRGHRQILALITLSGGPRPDMVVGGFTAPPPPKAGKPSAVRFARGRDALRISWGPAANASEYLVTVSLSDGQRDSYGISARKRDLMVPAVSATTSGRITVVAITSMGDEGRAAAASLAPVAAPPRVTDLKAKRSGKDVVVSWDPSHGAKLYTLKLAGPGVSGYTPRILAKPRFVSTRTLPALRAGSLVTIMVTPLAATGESGRTVSIRYRAPSRRS